MTNRNTKKDETSGMTDHSSSIISTVYVTLSFTSIVVWLFMRPFDLGQFIRYVAAPIGIILGIVSVSTKRERDS